MTWELTKLFMIEPPEGWSFEPKEVNLVVDGSTDKCSQGKDINFVFKGFAVTGKVVSSGSQIGPKGVQVTLYPEGKQDGLHSTMTAENGDFQFTPVLPGKYTVKASHPAWKLSKDSVNINLLKENNNIPANSLAPGPHNKSQVATCNENFEPSSPLCHVNSDEKGQFTFPSLPPGPYKVVPHYEGPHSIKFDVRPVEVLFTVEHKSLKIDTEFKVKGFSVSGRVLLRAGGEGIAGAVILLDGKSSSVTKADGSYHLENMQAGSYVLQVQAS
ncbi:hypothetical protein L9F63_025785, partial [Diploptera punctata]